MCGRIGHKNTACPYFMHKSPTEPITIKFANYTFTPDNIHNTFTESRKFQQTSQVLLEPKPSTLVTTDLPTYGPWMLIQTKKSSFNSVSKPYSKRCQEQPF